MERCLDCNSVLTSKEKVCPVCGVKVGHGYFLPAASLAPPATSGGGRLRLRRFRYLPGLPWRDCEELRSHWNGQVLLPRSPGKHSRGFPGAQQLLSSALRPLLHDVATR